MALQPLPTHFSQLRERLQVIKRNTNSLTTRLGGSLGRLSGRKHQPTDDQLANTLQEWQIAAAQRSLSNSEAGVTEPASLVDVQVVDDAGVDKVEDSDKNSDEATLLLQAESTQIEQCEQRYRGYHALHSRRVGKAKLLQCERRYGSVGTSPGSLRGSNIQSPNNSSGSDEIIAPISPPMPPTSSAQSEVENASSHLSGEWWEDEVEYVPSHPYYNTTPVQRQMYWDGLSRYTVVSQASIRPTDRDTNTEISQNAPLPPPAPSIATGPSHTGSLSDRFRDSLTLGVRQIVDAGPPSSNGSSRPGSRPLGSGIWRETIVEQMAEVRREKLEEHGVQMSLETGQKSRRTSVGRRVLHGLLCRPGRCSPDCSILAPDPQVPRICEELPLPPKFKVRTLPERAHKTLPIRRRSARHVSEDLLVTSAVAVAVEDPEQIQPGPSHKKHSTVPRMVSLRSRFAKPQTLSTQHQIPAPEMLEAEDEEILLLPPARLSNLIIRAPTSMQSTPSPAPLALSGPPWYHERLQPAPFSSSLRTSEDVNQALRPAASNYSLEERLCSPKVRGMRESTAHIASAAKYNDTQDIIPAVENSRHVPFRTFPYRNIVSSTLSPEEPVDNGAIHVLPGETFAQTQAKCAARMLALNQRAEQSVWRERTLAESRSPTLPYEYQSSQVHEPQPDAAAAYAEHFDFGFLMPPAPVQPRSTRSASEHVEMHIPRPNAPLLRVPTRRYHSLPLQYRDVGAVPEPSSTLGIPILRTRGSIVASQPAQMMDPAGTVQSLERAAVLESRRNLRREMDREDWRVGEDGEELVFRHGGVGTWRDV